MLVKPQASESRLAFDKGKSHSKLSHSTRSARDLQEKLQAWCFCETWKDLNLDLLIENRFSQYTPCKMQITWAVGYYGVPVTADRQKPTAFENVLFWADHSGFPYVVTGCHLVPIVLSFNIHVMMHDAPQSNLKYALVEILVSTGYLIINRLVGKITYKEHVQLKTLH